MPFLPALVAVGGMATAFATPVMALELGEIQVNSPLGQPLRASIAYALNADEQVSARCVSLAGGTSTSGLPMLSRARVSLDGRRIMLTGDVPVREPLLAMRLTVDCPYTARLSRDYTLMMDPATASATSATAQSAPQTTHTVRPQNVASDAETNRRTTAPRTRVKGAAIQQGSSYRVQAGDSASAIVSRIADRSTPLWPTVDAIVAANPDAFVNGDMNRMIAGSLLQIPVLEAPPRAASNAAGDTLRTPAPASREIAGANSRAYDGYDAAVSAAIKVSDSTGSRIAPVIPQNGLPIDTVPQPVIETRGEVPSTGHATVGAGTDNATSRVSRAAPGDVFANPDVPAGATVAPAAPTVNPPIVTQRVGDVTAATTPWLTWFGGTGIALILGLLLFGRRLRSLFGGVAENRLPPLHGNDVDSNAITQKSRVVADVDFRLDRQPGPTEREIELDADLGIGTGLTGTGDVDLVQDFGFSGTIVEEGPLDLEIPEHAAAAGQSSSTDIIPPQHQASLETILESEVPPSDDDADGDEDSDYDLSMIVDATKQALHDQEATTKDLMAVPIRTRDSVPDEKEYTLSKEIDYKILEQDYEDEMTATQALNEEIARAALELADRMDRDEDAGTASNASVDEITREMPRRDPEVTAELTAELPTDSEAQNDSFISDLDDTGVNEELTIRNDVTVEMEIETGTVDTKKAAG